MNVWIADTTSFNQYDVNQDSSIRVVGQMVFDSVCSFVDVSSVAGTNGDTIVVDHHLPVDIKHMDILFVLLVPAVGSFSSRVCVFTIHVATSFAVDIPVAIRFVE